MSSFVKKAEKLTGGCGEQYYDVTFQDVNICDPNSRDGMCYKCRKAQATALDFLQEFKERVIEIDNVYPGQFSTTKHIIKDITHAIEILSHSHGEQTSQEAKPDSNTTAGGASHSGAPHAHSPHYVTPQTGERHDVGASGTTNPAVEVSNLPVDTHCPNCNNRDLSDTNLKCPHCGNKSPQTSSTGTQSRNTE